MSQTRIVRLEAYLDTVSEYRELQRVQAVGRLAGSVAHDVSNLLAVVMTCSEMLLSDLDSDDSARKSVELIRKAAERAVLLARRLLVFSRQPSRKPARHDLNQLLHELEEILNRLLGKEIELITQYHPDLPQVRIDPGELDQIVMNLAANARDAMPDGGQLVIATECVPADHPCVLENLAGDSAHAVITVRDTGIGMNEETQARIFEPFFTTKDAGKGTGLGLATVLGIVRENGAHIQVHSTLGSGTTFKIYFPKAAEIQESADAGCTPDTSTSRASCA